MFRATQNQFDEAVAKATDENLTSENWELILDVCDKVTGNENGGKDVVAALMKRLSNRNANVQLLALELANALSQNCGISVHRELASKSFTDSLLRLAADRVSAAHRGTSGPELMQTEYTPASQVEDLRANGRVDRDVPKGPRPWLHGAGLHATEVTE